MQLPTNSPREYWLIKATPSRKNLANLCCIAPDCGRIIRAIGVLAVTEFDREAVLINKVLDIITKTDWLTGADVDDAIHLILLDDGDDLSAEIFIRKEIVFASTAREWELVLTLDLSRDDLREDGTPAPVVRNEIKPTEPLHLGTMLAAKLSSKLTKGVLRNTVGRSGIAGGVLVNGALVVTDLVHRAHYSDTLDTSLERRLDK